MIVQALILLLKSMQSYLATQSRLQYYGENSASLKCALTSKKNNSNRGVMTLPA